ncbi:hypothetical protein ACLOJK_020711 [Asimina triloba]
MVRTTYTPKFYKRETFMSAPITPPSMTPAITSNIIEIKAHKKNRLQSRKAILLATKLTKETVIMELANEAYHKEHLFNLQAKNQPKKDINFKGKEKKKEKGQTFVNITWNGAIKLKSIEHVSFNNIAIREAPNQTMLELQFDSHLAEAKLKSIDQKGSVMMRIGIWSAQRIFLKSRELVTKEEIIRWRKKKNIFSQLPIGMFVLQANFNSVPQTSSVLGKSVDVIRDYLQPERLKSSYKKMTSRRKRKTHIQAACLELHGWMSSPPSHPPISKKESFGITYLH